MRFKTRTLPRYVPSVDRPSTYRQNVYRAICTYALDHGGNCPTTRELMGMTGISSTSVVAYHIQALVKLGKLEIKDRKLVVVGGVWTPPPGELGL